MFRGAVLGVTDGEFSFLLFLPSTMHKQHKELNFLLKGRVTSGQVGIFPCRRTVRYARFPMESEVCGTMGQFCSDTLRTISR